MKGCEFPCQLDTYMRLVKNMRPTKEDKDCYERLHTGAPRLRSFAYPTLYLNSPDSQIAFAAAGYGVLDFKYGNELIVSDEN